MPELDYDKEKQEALLMGIYMGAVNLYHLPKGLYKETAEVLKKGLYKGYGPLSEFEFGSPDYKLLQELRDNVYMFSAAKTATSVDEIKSLVYKNNERLSYPDFKKAALARYNDYNKSYLESEYVTAMTTGGTALKLKDAYSDTKTFPLLRYVAIIDENTSKQCEKTNGLTLPVKHPFWNKYTPPLHFNCRCHLESIDKYSEIDPTEKETVKEITKFNNENVNKVFKMNPVKDKYVFSDKHHYFEIGKRPEWMGWARRNWNLPIPHSD